MTEAPLQTGRGTEPRVLNGGLGDVPVGSSLVCLALRHRGCSGPSDLQQVHKPDGYLASLSRDGARGG